MNSATWVIQSNRIKTSQTLPLVRALNDLREPFVDVGIADDELLNTLPTWTSNRLIPYGSTALVAVAERAKWEFLFFNRATYNVQAWRAHPQMLNPDCEVMTLSQAKETVVLREKVFVRPLNDLKEFHGHVIGAEAFVKWVSRLEEGDCEISGECMVAVSEPKGVQMEWRYFIVGGRIVTGSSYRHNGQPHQKREVDTAVLDEAQALADMWLPHENCCMDVALCCGEPKVVEFNCLNASGFYDHDVKAFARAVSKYAKEH